MITWFDVPKEGMSPGSQAIIPTGNIELTENGEGIDVSTYATATVNVSGGGGGGDFSTAEVSLILTFDAMEYYGASLSASIAIYDNSIKNPALIPLAIPSGSTSVTTSITVPLYKNKLITDLSAFMITGDAGTLYADYNDPPSASGNATIDDYVATITGDCVITIPMMFDY